jgi:hypothetical protein
MATLAVGPGQEFPTLASAIAASSDGDTISVQAGTYVNDFAEVATKVTIQSVGGMANFVATEAPPNGKAILTTDTDVTVSGLAFSGSAVPDGNGAGIRYQGGNLTLNGDYFFNNQDGLLSSASIPGGTLTINGSEFAYNGTGDGQTHNLYVGDIANLVINGSYFHDAAVGHEIKSRAENLTVENSRIQDQGGTASYSIEAANGGNATIANNVIEQGPNSQNEAIIQYGGEGAIYPSSSLTVSGNTILNDLNAPSATAVVNDTDVVAQITNNSVYGLTADQIARGPAYIANNAFLASELALDTSHPWDDPPPPAAVSAADVAALGSSFGYQAAGTAQTGPAYSWYGSWQPEQSLGVVPGWHAGS